MTDTFDYAEARADGDELVTEFGTAVQVQKITNSGSELEPTQTPASTSTKGVRLDFTRRHMARWNPEENDQRWLLAAGPLGAVVPGPGDKLVGYGAIVRVDAVNPAGTPVLYDVQVRP